MNLPLVHDQQMGELNNLDIRNKRSTVGSFVLSDSMRDAQLGMMCDVRKIAKGFQ